MSEDSLQACSAGWLAGGFSHPCPDIHRLKSQTADMLLPAAEYTLVAAPKLRDQKVHFWHLGPDPAAGLFSDVGG